MNATFPLSLGLPPLPAALAALAAPAAGAENPDEIVRQAFRIGHMRLLAPFASASELVEMPNVYPLPRMPENLLGLVNLHGRIVPLFDLAALFETEHLARERRMLLVIGHGNDAAGIVIDGLPRRMAFMPESQIVPPALSQAAATAVIATYRQGPDAWFEFDYAQLLEQLVS
ncbi:MAG TPA: chemotaxis protein CheW [Steroidobacteraceae bacterium]|jgi:purine-binding chemotaxis protein CheW|nr:chemotaxis protein CheW [Steroidobacteraceae bacterium]